MQSKPTLLEAFWISEEDNEKIVKKVGDAINNPNRYIQVLSKVIGHLNFSTVKFQLENNTN